MSRKRIKKYNAGGATPGLTGFQSGLGQLGVAGADFWRQEDMADGNLSVGGALGSGALKGASMGAAFGPWGALAGGVIGAGASLLNRNEINQQMEAEAEAKRIAEERRQFELDQAEKAATDAILENYPVKGVAQPRFALGGDTDPNKPDAAKSEAERHLFVELPLNARRVFGNDDMRQALRSMTDEERQKLYGEIKKMDGMFEEEGGLATFSNMDLSWAKPIRKRLGVSKNQIVDAAVETGALKPAFSGPVKAAAWLMDFGMGGSTVPQYMAEGGEMIQHQSNDVPKTDNNGNLNRMTATEAEIKGDKHSAKSGGVGMSDNKGARIYSDQLTADKELVAKLMKP